MSKFSYPKNVYRKKAIIGGNSNSNKMQALLNASKAWQTIPAGLKVTEVNEPKNSSSI